MFETRNQDFFNKVLDLRNLNKKVYLDSNDDGSLKEKFKKIFYRDNSSDEDSDFVEFLEVNKTTEKKKGLTKKGNHKKM